MYIQAWEYKPGEDVLCHYGKLHKSGRYPWGSGDRPYQRGGGPGRAHASVAEKKQLSKAYSSGNTRRSKHSGIKKAVRAAKRGLIKVNMYPVSLMSDEELNAKIERLRREDSLRNLRGKRTASEQKRLRDNKTDMVKPLVNDTVKAMAQQILIPAATGFVAYKLKNAVYNNKYSADDAKNMAKLKAATKAFVNMDDDELDYNIKRMEKVKRASDAYTNFDFNQPSGKKPSLDEEIFSRMKSGGGGGGGKKKGNNK